MSGENVLNYVEQGAARTVIGGSLDVVSGGDVDLEAGAVLKIAGVQVLTSAAELNILNGVTATAAEIDLACDLSKVGALSRIVKIHVAAGDHSAETDTAWDLPAKSIVRDVFIDVTTAHAGITVSVGTLSSEAGGDADGFVAAASLATPGLVRPSATLDGTNNWFVTDTRGALLSKFVAGANADDRGLYAEVPYPSTANTAKSVSYTASANSTAVYDIYIVYDELG